MNARIPPRDEDLIEADEAGTLTQEGSKEKEDVHTRDAFGAAKSEWRKNV